VNHLGLSGKPDWVLAERAIQDEFTLVTNNRSDFVRIFGRMDLHPGLIILVPNVSPTIQQALFRAALQYSGPGDLVNTVLVSLENKTVHCVAYQLPAR
jgi:predicted nuclease of predicted toxin-antitoxin system